MLNSKQPPRVNAVRAGKNAGRHGGETNKKHKHTAVNREFYQDANAERLEGHSHVETNWQLTAEKDEQVGVITLTWPGMDGGGGQKYGLLNRGSAILKSTFVLATLKTFGVPTCRAMNAPRHSILSHLQIFQTRTKVPEQTEPNTQP